MRLLNSIFRLLFVLTLGFSFVAPAEAAEEKTVEERYEDGERFSRRGYYIKALEEFNTIRNLHREHPLAVQSELAIADVYYNQGEWDIARMAYDEFMRLHPRHERLDYAVFQLGMTSFEKAPRIAARDQTSTRHALNTWTGFGNRFPDSGYREVVEENIAICRNRLARKEMQIGYFYFRKGAFAAAIGRFERLLGRYPDSPDRPRTLVLMAIALGELGERERALEVVGNFRENHPDNRRAQALLRRKGQAWLNATEELESETP